MKGEREQVLADQPVNRGFAPGGGEITAIRLIHVVDASGSGGKDRMKNGDALSLGISG